MAISHVLAAAAGAGVAVAVDRVRRSEATAAPAATIRSAGSTLAAPSAALWVTDLLNAAYYAKDVEERDVNDLRLAFAVIATYWNEHEHRRLQATDVLRFHRAFGTARLRGSGGRTGTLDTDALLAGGNKLFGDWFAEAAGDPARRGWGIVFPTVEHKHRHDPEIRLAQTPLGPLTPPRLPEHQQIWHSYPAVEVPDAAATVAALLEVDQWPEYGSALGRLTPLRRRELDGQTFEIETIGFAASRTPILVRSYVSVENLVTEANEDARDGWVTQLRLGFAARPEEPAPIPEGAEVHAAFDLVAHEGHFLGNAKTRVMVYTHEDRSFVRAAGTWDPVVGRNAEVGDQVARWNQHAFWGMSGPDESMLHQLALTVGER